MRNSIIVFLFLILSVTSANSETSHIENVTQFCNDFTPILVILSDLNDNDKLTPIQIEQVGRVVLVMDPVCRSDIKKLSKPILELANNMVIVVDFILKENNVRNF